MLGQRDLLNEYIKHVGTGLFAVPPGLRKAGDWYGKALFTYPASVTYPSSAREARGESGGQSLWRSSRDWLLRLGGSVGTGRRNL
jgi:hypothetical protein